MTHHGRVFNINCAGGQHTHTAPPRAAVGYTGSISVLVAMHWHAIPPERLLLFVDGLVSVAGPMCAVSLVGAMLHFTWASQH